MGVDADPVLNLCGFVQSSRGEYMNTVLATNPVLLTTLIS